MATNNAINLNSSGIVKYDGAGTFSALSTPLSLANGGTGASSFTAYAVICGGNPSSNPLTNVASVGTSGQVLTFNGSSSLPTFQAVNNKGYWVYLQSPSGNPASSTTYFFSNDSSLDFFTASGSAQTQIYMPKAGTITKATAYFHVDTAGSSETITLAIRLNNTTNTNIISSISLSTTQILNTSLSVSVAVGDYIEITLACPAWVTPPSGVSFTLSLYISA